MMPIYLVVFTVGFSAIILQLTALREFFSVFYGNELVFGIVLGNWLLLTGIGSYLGRFSHKINNKIFYFIVIQILLSLALPVTLFLASTIKEIVVLPGEIVSLPLVFSTSFVILMPFCVMSGFQIIFAWSIISRYSEQDGEGAAEIGRIYSIETLGSLIGGIVFSCILVTLLTSFQIVYFALFSNLAACFILSSSRRLKKMMLAIAILFVLSGLFFSIVDLRGISNKLQYPGQDVLFQRNSLYGNLVVTNTSNQINFFENGVPLFTTEDTMRNEEAVHYAMVQHDNPKDVLLVSGGVSGILNEILKYETVDNIDYVELDPLLVDAGRRYAGESGINNPRVKLVNVDGRLFIREKASLGEKYDVVLLTLPDPTTAQMSRFYTLESFKEVKEILKEDGIISLSISSSENYLNPETKKLNSCIYQTLVEVFRNVVVIPGDRNYFIASDGDLGYDIAGKIEEKRVNTSYVNRYYLSGKLTEGRINYTLSSIKGEGEVNINTDFKPVSYYYYLLYWTGYFKINLKYLIAVILVFFVILFIRLKRIPLAVFTVGFAGTSLEVVLVIAFQVLYGYTYYKIGVIVTAFMFGLFLGAAHATKRLEGKERMDLTKIVFYVAAYSIILPLGISFLSTLSGPAITLSIQIVFPLLTAFLGFLVGALFPIANEAYIKDKSESPQSAMGLLYSVDLFGAFFGSLLASIFLIPVYGIINVSIIAGLLNLISGLKLLLTGK